MRVAIIDTELTGLDFAVRCVEHDHEVMLFQQTDHPIGKGFVGVKRTNDLATAMTWCKKDGLVVPTGNAKFTRVLDRWREIGFQIFGPTVQSAALEIDRGKGMELMKAAGIDLPHYETFDSLEAAEKFARKAQDPYVFKPLGSEDDKSLTYVSSTPADMVGWIQRQRARGAKTTKCMLQEKVDLIADFGVSSWFGPEGFLPDKAQECFEHKKLCNGEKGPNTGEMGTLTCYMEKSKLFDDMLAPMAPALAALGHRGDTAIGVAVDTKGKAWPLEMTMRLGWPCFYLQCASHKGDPVQWMMDLMKDEDTLKVDYRPTIGVVLAQPPWPKFDGKPECVEGIPITGLDEVWDSVHPAMCQIGRGPVMDGDRVKDGAQYQTAGEMVAIVTGLGSTVEKARKSAYGAIDGIRFSDMIYRTDIGEKVEKCLPKLQAAGYCKGLEYE
jgi:phosphoribosylamine--glycine ligase